MRARSDGIGVWRRGLVTERADTSEAKGVGNTHCPSPATARTEVVLIATGRVEEVVADFTFTNSV